MKIIDAHCHIFPDKIAQKATDSIGKFYDLEMECGIGSSPVLLQEGDNLGVSGFVVCSTATKPHQVVSINDFIAQACAQNPRFTGLATMFPGFEDVYGELQRAKAMGLHGIKLHPDFQAFLIDDPAALPIYEAAQELEMPILFHTGDKRYPYSHPSRLAKICRMFPRLLTVGAHFGGYSVWDQLDAYEGVENVCFDTSSSLAFIDPEQAVSLIHRFGAERFMFGSDFPMWREEDELARFLALPLTQDEQEQILYRTAERVYGAKAD